MIKLVVLILALTGGDKLGEAEFNFKTFDDMNTCVQFVESEEFLPYLAELQKNADHGFHQHVQLKPDCVLEEDQDDL